MRRLKWSRYLTPARILVIGFAVLIFLGAVLLSLPVASKSGEVTPFVDALFTATSAVCLTGLVVVDTGTHYSLFGHIVILFLVQLGGLGFMTVATFVTIMTGRRIGLKERLLIQESLKVDSLQGLIRLSRNVVFITLAIELLFAIIMTIRFLAEMPLGKAVYFGVFHSISAFCNAGFDLFGDYKSVADYAGDPVINFSIITLVLIGGLGFTVLVDLGRKFRGSDRLMLHTKLVLIFSGTLLVLGTLVYYALESANPDTLGGMPEWKKWLAALFASMTARSSGFSTINYQLISDGSALFSMLLMYIGGSPGSMGGGIKNITALVILLYIWTVVSNKEQTVVFKRAVPPRTIYKALVIAMMAAGAIFFVTLLLTITEEIEFIRLMFEATSAVATVGLSMNVTPELSNAGKWIVLVAMYVGRLGPLTIALALAARQPDKAHLKYPEDHLYVG